MSRFLSLMALASFFAGVVLLAGILPGCGELESGDVITGPAQPPADNVSQLEANAARMQTWIDRMDPYVTQAGDGTYTLDWRGFLQSIGDTHHEVIRYFAVGSQPNEDAKVIEQLKDGIPAANATFVAHPARRSLFLPKDPLAGTTGGADAAATGGLPAGQ